MQNHPQGRAPDYTSACLVMGLVNLLWVLIAIWAWKGLSAVLIVGLLLHLAIQRLEQRTARVRAQS